MPKDVGVIPEFFYPDGIPPILTKEFLANIPDNSRIIIYKGALRRECYIIIEDGATHRKRAFSKQHTFNECIKELETSDMSLPQSLVPETFKIEKSKRTPDISDKQVNDMIRKLWSQMEKE